MLPEGFQWRDNDDGITLLCLGDPVADATVLEGGRVRVCRHPNVQPSYAFGNGMDAARAYLERWAHQHADRITDTVRQRQAAARFAAEVARAKPPGPPIQTTHHRRRQSRRAF